MRQQLNRLMDSNVYLFGVSGHAKVVIDILQLLDIKPRVIYDDHPNHSFILGIEVRNSNSIDPNKIEHLFISIGNNLNRKKVAEKFVFKYLNVIRPQAILAHSLQMGHGNCVMGGAVINPDVKIGNHCIINTGAVVEHDALVEDYVHISPNASLAGNVTVGEGTHVGIGASVIQGIKIGKWAVVGAGAVVVNDVPDFATVVGVPAKVISINNPFPDNK